MEKKCELCGMPLENERFYGTDKRGKKKDHYCIYCYKDGEFAKELHFDESNHAPSKEDDEREKDIREEGQKYYREQEENKKDYDA